MYYRLSRQQLLTPQPTTDLAIWQALFEAKLFLETNKITYYRNNATSELFILLN
jgi:hypothetical protein